MPGRPQPLSEVERGIKLIKLASLSNKVFHAITWVGGIVLTINVLLVVANIILRRVFNSPIFGATEYVQYISLIAGALGLCQNEWYGGNVTMTLVLEKLSSKAREIVKFICDIISSVGFVFVSYLMINDVFSKFAKNDVTNTLGMPRWIFVAILAFGVVMLTLAIIAKTVIQGSVAFGGQPINLRDPESKGVDADILE